MWIKHAIVTFIFTFLCLQQIAAVVNNGAKTDDVPVNATNDNIKNNTVVDDTVNEDPALLDSVAESTEQKSNRREAPHAVYGVPIPSNSYGTPLDSYVPSSPSNVGLPVPVYGVPDVSSNNVVYPAPPPDIPPNLSNTYGSPNLIIQDLPPKPFPPIKFNPHGSRPQKPFSFPKPVYGPPSHFGFPIRPQYGPPKHLFNNYKPKPIIKVPKLHYGAPKPLYLPYKPGSTYGLPQVYGPPKPVYGPPKIIYGPPMKYHPDPIPHGPPPGVPAPPTPPVIKYDGWQPIPGLVSRPPSGSYGAPQAQQVDSHQYNVDLVPPHGDAYNKPQGVSDSYNAPLNSVTGSGGVVSTSGNDHGGRGISGSSDHSAGGVSVIKSIGYEIFSNPSVGGVNSYSTAPLSSYASFGAQNNNLYNINSGSSSTIDSFSNAISSSFDTTLGANGAIGLIPPSGVYGVPPSGSYGTPLLQPLNLGQQSIIFKESSLGGLSHTGGISSSQNDVGIESALEYKPPSIPNVVETEPHVPTSLYSLPTNNPTSFQNFVQGSSTHGLHSDNNNFNYNAAQLTSYTAPSGIVDGSYGLPHSNAATSFDSVSNNYALSQNYQSAISGSYGTPYFAGYQSGGHDCSQKSLPLPSLSFGVPAANSYSASLASLNTNIAGAYQGASSNLNYGAPDLQIAYSHTTNSVSNGTSNSIKQEGRSQSDGRAKAISESIAGDNELIKSQSIDLNNIPLQGALGSYTLQIQSANGGSPNIPHNQVLNDGLLQSILNAIEQPQQNTATILSQPLLHLQQIPPQVQQQDYSFLENYNNQNALTKNIVVTPPPLQRDEEETPEKDVSVPLIDSNEIALYFNNNPEMNEDTNNRNAQQYESYVTFTSANNSYAYGDSKQQKEKVEMIDLKV
ncbi:hypothetical protein RN001_016203 [Aquatica leii]|uniref:Enamelin n=1 Tax=Aquatica leii TaxID=1421715 RepID=A0AAN7NXN3_9COLE|nr:hypothetical protein RN001_016203 [Aquatica leii]